MAPVPPEEFLISRDARSLEDARFVGHRRRRTVSSLIEEGYSRDLIESLSSDETSMLTDSEEIKRNTVESITPISSSGQLVTTVTELIRGLLPPEADN